MVEARPDIRPIAQGKKKKFPAKATLSLEIKRDKLREEE
jgi:hypothetical protein